MALLLKGGTVVNADGQGKADVWCEDGLIKAVGPELDPGSARVIDVSGALVMPGGIDPHTPMELPFMGTVASEDSFTGTSAAAAGGTTMIIDFVIPAPEESLLAAFEKWRGLQAGMLQTTATDHCCFCSDQKAMGKDDFRLIPNGTGGVEDRMTVLWHHGVNTGRLTPSEFVAVTSSNTSKILNIYPRKGVVAVGADADLVVWDPAKTRTISAKTHHQNIDFNIYEGMETRGNPALTLSRGRVVWEGDALETARGAGRWVDRPCSAPYWAAQRLRNEHTRAHGVARV